MRKRRQQATTVQAPQAGWSSSPEHRIQHNVQLETGRRRASRNGAIAFGLVVFSLAAGIVLTALLSRALPAGSPHDPESFLAAFSTRSMVSLNVLVAGIFLIALSGLLEMAAGAGLFPVLREHDPAFTLALVSGSASRKLFLILGATNIATAMCLLSVVPACRRAGHREAGTSGHKLCSSLLLVPPAVLVIRLVVTYREVSVIPSLAVYYVEILALVALTLAFYRLSSFAFQSGDTCRFTLYAVSAVLLCLTTLADQTSFCGILFYLGCALSLLGFLLLRLCQPGK